MTRPVISVDDEKMRFEQNEQITTGKRRSGQPTQSCNYTFERVIQSTILLMSCQTSSSTTNEICILYTILDFIPLLVD